MVNEHLSRPDLLDEIPCVDYAAIFEVLVQFEQITGVRSELRNFGFRRSSTGQAQGWE
jgi:hypothetical protein